MSGFGKKSGLSRHTGKTENRINLADRHAGMHLLRPIIPMLNLKPL